MQSFYYFYFFFLVQSTSVTLIYNFLKTKFFVPPTLVCKASASESTLGLPTWVCESFGCFIHLLSCMWKGSMRLCVQSMQHSDNHAGLGWAGEELQEEILGLDPYHISKDIHQSHLYSVMS